MVTVKYDKILGELRESDIGSSIVYTDSTLMGDGSISDPLSVVGIGSPTFTRVEVESLFKVAYNTAYHEFIYTNGDLTQIDVYEDDTKTNKLFTKEITYLNSNIDTITITDEINSKILTKTFSYDIDGNIETIEKAYS